MSINYKCHKCYTFESSYFSDMKKHINRKFPCKKNNKFMFLSDDQSLILSIIPNNITDKNLQHLTDSKIINKNMNELFNELERIDKNKLKKCKYCNKDFPLISDLKTHINIYCFYDEIKKRDNTNLYNSNIYNHCENINTNNIQTLNNTNIQTLNNININLEIKTPIPFDNEWNISKINNDTKGNIIISKVMYTRLLEEILNDEINLNVIIDKEKDSGMVYKNDIDKYIQMKSKDIVSKTMNKINQHLIDINKENNKAFEEILDFSRKMINKKYIDYQNNKKIQDTVDDIICNIFENKKTDAICIAKKIMDTNIIKDGY